jgi:hypothetical protein
MFASLQGRVNARAATIAAQIVEKIALHPRGACKPIEIEIDGQLAAILR